MLTCLRFSLVSRETRLKRGQTWCRGEEGAGDSWGNKTQQEVEGAKGLEQEIWKIFMGWRVKCATRG